MSNWLSALQNLPYENLTQIPESDKSVLVNAFRILGEPFLLALDDIDQHRVLRVTHIERFQRDHERAVPIYLAQGSQSNLYEVRLGSWSCSCAQFALSAYVITNTATNGSTQALGHSLWGGSQLRAGAHSASAHVPYCRHLIASTLQEYGGTIFESTRRERPADTVDMDSIETLKTNTETREASIISQNT